MKSRNLKEEIKLKAGELFFRHGPKHVSMEEIAESSGISKKTIYQICHNKNDLVLEVVEDLLQTHSQVFEKARVSCRDAIDEVLKQDAGLRFICRNILP